MPMPSLEPSPPSRVETRRGAPLLAQDASYFAASARMESFCSSFMRLLQQRLLQKVAAIGRLHAHLADFAFVRYAQGNLGARGTLLPHLAEELAELSHRPARGRDDDVAEADAGLV